MSTQRVIAHRGLSSRAPENTMSAFRAAVEAGIKWIETDVDIIGDGTAVLIHDSSLDRTTNCRGRYNELTPRIYLPLTLADGFRPSSSGSRCRG